MSNREYGGGTLVVYAQVGQAKANHRVENDTGFLRPKSFSLPSKVVYLGDRNGNFRPKAEDWV